MEAAPAAADEVVGGGLPSSSKAVASAGGGSNGYTGGRGGGSGSAAELREPERPSLVTTHDAKLEVLLSMGWERSPASFALEQAKGDVERAVELLGEAQAQESETVASAAADESPNTPVKPTVFYRFRAAMQSVNDEGPASAVVDFVVISNDDSERNAVWLVALREIFSRQLPKMPRDYIAKLVTDKTHQSLLCFESGIVVGGITFRPYVEQRFGEIAFCAVSASHQVKGYGTRLMNHLKEYVKSRLGLTHFLTYADNFAIGYFKKQGFTTELSLPRETWEPLIKDYEGGTLMECVVHPRIDYLNTREMIASQREFVLGKMEEVRSVDPVYPGLERLLSGRIDDAYEQVPGLKEAGWRRPFLPSLAALGNAAPAVRGVPPTLPSSEMQNAMRRVVDRLWAFREAWPFREPVPSVLLDYFATILEPIDLSLIRARVEHGHYASMDALRRDVDLMLENCVTYNPPDTPYHKAAVAMQGHCRVVFLELPDFALSFRAGAVASTAVAIPAKSVTPTSAVATAAPDFTTTPATTSQSRANSAGLLTSGENSKRPAVVPVSQLRGAAKIAALARLGTDSRSTMGANRLNGEGLDTNGGMTHAAVDEDTPNGGKTS